MENYERRSGIARFLDRLRSNQMWYEANSGLRKENKKLIKSLVRHNMTGTLLTWQGDIIKLSFPNPYDSHEYGLFHLQVGKLKDDSPYPHYGVSYAYHDRPEIFRNARGVRVSANLEGDIFEFAVFVRRKTFRSKGRKVLTFTEVQNLDDPKILYASQRLFNKALLFATYFLLLHK